MIKNRNDLKDDLYADKTANEMTSILKRITSIKWKYLCILRKTEYYINTSNSSKINRMIVRYCRYRLYRVGLKTGWTIGPNCFGKGLILPHYGTIVVNGSARFGDDCVVQCGVNVSENVKGGNHIYFAAGAKIMSNIVVGDDVIIGANAVVTKSVDESNVVLAGVPAKIISYNGYKDRTKV